MKQHFSLIFFAITFLYTSCNSLAQQKDDYSNKIDSLLKSNNPYNFNGVILVTKNGKVKYSKDNN